MTSEPHIIYFSAIRNWFMFTILMGSLTNKVQHLYISVDTNGVVELWPPPTSQSSLMARLSTTAKPTTPIIEGITFNQPTVDSEWDNLYPCKSTLALTKGTITK